MKYTSHSKPPELKAGGADDGVLIGVPVEAERKSLKEAGSAAGSFSSVE